MYPITLFQEEINRIFPNTRVCLTPDLTQIILINSEFDDSLTIKVETMEITSSTEEPTYFHTLVKENLTEIVDIFHKLTINIFPYLAKHFDFICKETLETNMFQLKYKDHTSCMVKLLPESPYMKVSAIHSTDYNNLKDFDHQLNMLNITFERNRRWQSSTYKIEKEMKEAQHRAVSEKQFFNGHKDKILHKHRESRRYTNSDKHQLMNHHSIVDRIETDTIKDNVECVIKSIMDFNTKIQSHFNNQSHTHPCDLYHFLLSTDELTIDTVKLINSKLSLDKKELSDKISQILNSHIGLSLLSEKTKREIVHTIEEFSETDQHNNTMSTIDSMLNTSTYTDEQIKILMASKHITPYERRLIKNLHKCELTFPTLLLKIKNRILH